MFSCMSCFESDLSTIGLLTQRRDSRTVAHSSHLFCDPLWHSIHADACLEAEREPALRSSIERSILAADGIEDALARVLSDRLCDRASDSSDLRTEFANVMRSNASIVDAAREDLLAIQAKDPATTSLLQPFMHFKGFLAVQGYRIAHALWKSDRRTLAYYLQSRVSEVFAVDIHPAATIGNGVFLDHGTGVVIGETAVVADGVTILHGVTLGGTGNDGGDRHPKVGRNVLIGAGSQLLGNIEIGEGSRIGAGSVVLRSVEPFSTVAGVPAKVVRRRPATIPLPRAAVSSG